MSMAVMWTPALLMLALAGCDRFAATSADGDDAAAGVASSDAPAPEPSDATLHAPSEAFLEAAEAYASTCYILSSIGDLGVSDRCYAKGECDSSIKANFDKDCGFSPEQPAAVTETAKKLAAAAEGLTLSPEAQVFVRHAELFGRFVAVSHRADARCLEIADGFSRPGCWATTAGTLAKYQAMAKAFNAWQPERRRELVPVDRVIMSGAAAIPVHKLLIGYYDFDQAAAEAAKKTLATEGLPWQRCPDGPCIADRASAY